MYQSFIRSAPITDISGSSEAWALKRSWIRVESIRWWSVRYWALYSVLKAFNSRSLGRNLVYSRLTTVSSFIVFGSKMESTVMAGSEEGLTKMS